MGKNSKAVKNKINIAKKIQPSIEGESKSVSGYASLEELRKNSNKDLFTNSCYVYTKTGKMPVSQFFVKTDHFYNKFNFSRAARIYRQIGRAHV